MRRRKKEKLEFRYYEIPPGESVLALMGEDWVGPYGSTDSCRHFHNLFEIGYCHYGNGLLVLGEEEHVYENEMISAIPANYPHITVSEGEDFWEFLFLDPEQLLQEMFPDQPRLQDELLERVNRRAELFYADDQPELSSTVRKLFREMSAKQPFYRESVRHLIRIYLLELIRLHEGKLPELDARVTAGNTELQQVLPALPYIETHYAEQIRAGELARCCGLSEVHFRRVFEERVHVSPIEYLNRVRIRKACRMMTQRDCSMEVVAEECGFACLSSFNRNFKKYMEVTPYQWKRNKNNYQSQIKQYNISTQKGWESL